MLLKGNTAIDRRGRSAGCPRSSANRTPSPRAPASATTRIPMRTGRTQARGAPRVVAEVEHPHGPWDVLQVLRTEILEGQAGACAHLLTDHRGHTDPARVGQRLHAGCDV